MAGQQDNRIQCAEFDTLLSQAIDGTLAGERLAAFEAHGRDCKLCGPLLQEAEAGHTWLKSLAEVEPPEELVTNILLRTSGVLTSRQGAAGRAVTTSWMDRVREWGSALFSPVVFVARQPRFAMSFGMAFFTLSVTLSLAGVRLSDLRHVDLRPSAVRRTYYETSGRVVKYYENIRFVYEIESRVRQFKQAATPEEQPRQQQDDNDRKDKNKNNTSGQPEQKQERNYSQEGNQPVFASLPEDMGFHSAQQFVRIGKADPPVVSVTTYRRFV
jgi:hypothetical protein